VSLFSEYRNSLKMLEVEEILDLLIFRPLAFLFVKLILPLPLTPNQITIAALLLGVTGGVCFGLASPAAVHVGVALLAFSIVLDCADGQLARIKKNGTQLGRILDGFSDYIVFAAVYTGIAAGLVRNAGATSTTAILLILGAAISQSFQAVLVDYYRTLFLDIVLQRPDTFAEDLESMRREYQQFRESGTQPAARFLIRVYMGYSRLQRSLASGDRSSSSLRAIPPDRYFRVNRVTIRFWTFIGTTSQGVFLMICALLHRFDIYCWGLIIGANAYALVLLAVQARLNHTLHRSAIS
jgi:hypothetical protein